MSNRLANILFSLAIIVAGIVFIKMAAGFENLTALAGAQVPTQMFPIAVLCILIFCSTINLVKYVMPNGAADANDQLDMNLAMFIRVALILAILIATIAIWDRFGFLPASVFSSLTIAVVLQVRSPLIYLGLSLYGPATWAFFRYAVAVNI